MMRSRVHALFVLSVTVGVVAGCEFRERGDEEPEETAVLDRARAAPPAEVRDRLGPVFAPPEEAPLVLGDDFWAGPGTVGYELVGEFASREARNLVLDPEHPIGVYGERRWVLSDILIAVDFRSTPTGAIWRVAGPSEVLDSYVADLREGGARGTPVDELGVLPLEVRQAP